MTVEAVRSTTRPRSCRAWSCGWLLGHVEGDERRRPDKIGLIFNQEKLGGKLRMVAIEVWPGAGRESSNIYLLQKLSQQWPIILREYQMRSHEVITPNPAWRQQLRQLIDKEWTPLMQVHRQASLQGQTVVTDIQPPK